MTGIRDRAVALYDAYTHDHRDRRQLLREMAALAGSAAAAEALIAGVAAAPAAAALTDPNDRRLRIATREGVEAGRPLGVYLASPAAGPAPRGLVVVVHENRGLNDHIRDVARRFALAGFAAAAPDLLSPQGGTPADEDRARDMIAHVDYDLAIAQVRAALARHRPTLAHGGRGRAGLVGFCWGGAMVDRVAVSAPPELAAGVSYYGPAPSPAEAARVRAPLLLHYAGLDQRVDATARPWVAALRAAGKPFQSYEYPGVDHAFNNDTSAERYNKAAADLAWKRTLAFLRRRLDV